MECFNLTGCFDDVLVSDFQKQSPCVSATEPVQTAGAAAESIQGAGGGKHTAAGVDPTRTEHGPGGI